MPHIQALYFSPTKSSEKICQAVASTVAGELGLPLACHDLTLPNQRRQAQREGVRLDTGDVLVFAFPVYAGRVPPVVAQTLRILRGNGARAVILAVYGNRAYEDALAEAQDLLAAQGCAVVAGAAVIAEHSIVPDVGADRPDAHDMRLLDDFAHTVAKALRNGSASVVRLPGSRPYRAIPPAQDIRPQLDEGCTHCGACASVCPMGLIDAVNPAQVKSGCLKCHACVKICHMQARHFSEAAFVRIRELLQTHCREPKSPEFYC